MGGECDHVGACVVDKASISHDGVRTDDDLVDAGHQGEDSCVRD